MRRLLFASALLAGCPEGPQLASIQDAPPLISATVADRVSIDALLPSDVITTPGGAVWVLDGYGGRALRIGEGGSVTATLGNPEDWGHPLRLAPGPDEGLWLSDPAGRILLVDEAGTIKTTLMAPTLPEPAGARATPVAMLDLGDTLVVSDRQGRLSWLDAKTGEPRRTVDRDAEGDALSLLADLARTPEGRVVAVDTLLGRVQTFSGEGEPVSAHGRYGAWAGYLKQPRAVEPLGEGALAVADAELGAVQIFDEDGAARGVVAVDGAPLRLAHPVAMARGADGELLVLDAGAGVLIRLKLDERSLDDAMVGPARRWLRSPLSPAEELPPEGGQRCLQCHSGVVGDSREVWDRKLDAHPVNIKPEMEIPSYFPLDDQGQMVCSTCHSPHGAVTLDELKKVGDDAALEALAPHGGGDSTFLRMGRSSSELCVACHTESAHEGALDLLSLGGGGHPTGAALAAAMEERGEGDISVDALTEGQCLSCHAVHGASGEHLTRGEAEGELCVACHEDQATAGSTHPMGLTDGRVAVHPERSGLPLDEDGHVTCRTCHTLVGGRGEALLRAAPSGDALCASCHTTQAGELGGDHAHVRGEEGITCLGCHDPHGQSTDHEMLRGASVASKADPSGCLSCHGAGGAVAKASVRPGVLGHPVDGELHGGDKALTCESCHAAHDPRPKDAARCESCHKEQAEADHRGGHGEASCQDCHPPHSSAPVAKVAAGTNPRSATCLACHAEGSGSERAPKVASFTHEAMVFAPDGSRWTPLGDLPLFAADGTEQPRGTNGALTCSSCHLTHGPDAKEPGDNLRRPGWKEACAACHGEEALPLYRYFHQPDRWDDLEGKP